MRVLILSTTTGYQLRSFGDAASRTGIDLMFATDCCHQLDDPWRDGAVAVRFHEEEASLRAIVDAARARPIDGGLEGGGGARRPVGDAAGGGRCEGVRGGGARPVVLAAGAARGLGVRGNPPAA